MKMNFGFLFCGFVFMVASMASGRLILIGSNISTLSFDSINANFAPTVEETGKSGSLYVAEPLDACSSLTNKINTKKNGTVSSPFVLIIRGVCSFEEKVRRAQAAGFEAAIIYDNKDGGLIAMSGDSFGIRIPAIFVSRASGETLAKYAGLGNVELWILANVENSPWPIIAVSFLFLLTMSALLAVCFFLRERHRASRVREFHGMSGRLVKAMPSLIFTSVLEDNCTSITCAICLEDYNSGEKLRILPCRHKFHSKCVDAWLTSWRSFCPFCKRDARTSTAGEPPASEATPLLSSSTPASVSSSALSSFRSSVASSSAIRIGGPPRSSHSPSVSCPQSISTTPYHNNPYSL